MRHDVLNLLFFSLVERQTGQLHPIPGTPNDPTVPKSLARIFMRAILSDRCKDANKSIHDVSRFPRRRALHRERDREGRVIQDP